MELRTLSFTFDKRSDLATLLAVLTLGLAAACSSATEASEPASATHTRASSTANIPVEAERAIAEADIIQLDGGRLYALSRSGTLSVVDVSTPGELTLLGQTELNGEPFEMYRRDDLLFAMLNGGDDAEPKPQPSAAGKASQPELRARVVVLDVADPTGMAQRGALPVPGEITDSRIVGDVLYLATFENGRCHGCGSKPRTLVRSFDIAEPEAMRQVDRVAFESNAPGGSNARSWKRSIIATAQRLYVAGHADIAPNASGATKEGIIDVLDISDPQGHLGAGARIQVAGPIMSRWQLDEHGGILRVVSQRGISRTSSGIGAPELDTFRIESTHSFRPLGHITLDLPRQEGLRAVRFDGPRAYAITFYQADPLFVIDLSNPSRPEQRGELAMPGFIVHLEPHGGRLIGLGVDNTDLQGSLNVSLLDVSDVDDPRLLKRVGFGGPAALNGGLPEDQDRIQKAFRTLASGLVVVPFTASGRYGAPAPSCDDLGGGVQLVEWSGDTLSRRALLPVPGNPLRAFENDNEMIAVSDSNVRAFSLSDLDVVDQTGDLTIGTCSTSEPAYVPDFTSEGDSFAACSAAAAHGGGDGRLPLLGLVALIAMRNRRRARHVARPRV